MIPKVLGKSNAMPQKNQPSGKSIPKEVYLPPEHPPYLLPHAFVGCRYNDSFENHINGPVPANRKELQDFLLK